MQRASKAPILEVLAPLFHGIGSVVKIVYHITVGWWLDPWLQYSANRALWDDVQANLYFLASQWELVNSRPVKVLPFDYASVNILWENVLFIITRGRGDVSVSVAPRHAMRELYQLGPVIAALEHRHLSERDSFHDLGGAATLLRPRLRVLNTAFSEQEYLHIRERL
jgi:hypothetical protein